MQKPRIETVIGYRQAKESMQNQYEVVVFNGFRGGIRVHLQDPASKETCERIRSDAWEKLKKECHLDRTERRTKKTTQYVWKYGPAPKEPELVPMPGIEKLAELQQKPSLVLYTFGCNTYGGQLVTIKIPATNYAFAEKIARQMRDAAQELVDIDEGIWLNDEEVY